MQFQVERAPHVVFIAKPAFLRDVLDGQVMLGQQAAGHFGAQPPQQAALHQRPLGIGHLDADPRFDESRKPREHRSGDPVRAAGRGRKLSHRADRLRRLRGPAEIGVFAVGPAHRKVDREALHAGLLIGDRARFGRRLRLGRSLGGSALTGESSLELGDFPAPIVRRAPAMAAR